MNNIPIVKPIDIPEHNYKHSEYDIMPKLSLRGILVASSTGGQTVLIQNRILNIYRGSFERIIIFSPSIHVDDTWNAVKKYIREVMNFCTDRGPTYFEEYNPEALNKIIQTQHKVIDYQKKNKQKNLNSKQPMALPAPSPQPATTTPTYSEWSQTAEEPQRRSTAKQSFEKAKTPQKKAKPAPNVQEGGASSSSSGNAPQPQARTKETDRKGSRKTIKQNVKEAQEETSNMTLRKPSKIGIQKLRETFEEANNRNTIAKTTYKK